MATSWHDYTAPAAPLWLLVSGDTMETPALEVTSAMRRVRMKNNQTISDSYRNLDKLCARAAEIEARCKGDRLWMRLSRTPTTLHSPPDAPYIPNWSVGGLYDEGPASIQGILDASGNESGSRVAAICDFQHPELPLRARLSICLGRVGYYYKKTFDVKISLSFPSQTTDAPDNINPGVEFNGPPAGNGIPCTQDLAWGATEFKHLRPAILFFSEQVHKALDLESVRIPDMRKLEAYKKPDLKDCTLNDSTTLLLQQVDTNIGGEFLQDLADFANAEDTSKRALEAYAQLRKELRAMGITIEDSAETPLEGILSGQHVAMSIRGSTVDEDKDVHHLLHAHLDSGSILVNCVRPAETNAIDAWTIARFEAEMKGELDAFLGFHASVHKKIIEGDFQALVKMNQGKEDDLGQP